MVTRVKTSVNYTGIQNLFTPASGPSGVFDNAVQVSAEMKAAAILKAPSRTGSLKAAHRNFTVTHYLGIYVTITNTSNHAIFVAKGTHYIIPRKHQFLKLPATPMTGRSGPFIYRQYVRGQSANNWMDEAKDEVLRLHGLA